MRGRNIVLYFLWYFVVVSCGFLFTSCWLLTIYYRWFRRSRHVEEDQEPLLERMRLEHQRADLENKIGYLEADVAYLRSDYLFLNVGAKKDAMFATICGLDSEIQQLNSELASVNSELSYY